MPLDARPLCEALGEAGVRTLAGVPCAILDPIVRAAEQDQRLCYLPASVEGEAVAYAAGAWLAGDLGGVLLQNSGLGNTINPLASLAIPYRIPMLLIVSWRGEPGTHDAIHHEPMGAATPGLFELFGIAYEVLRETSQAPASVRRARDTLRHERRPYALLVPRGLFVAERPAARAPIAGLPGPPRAALAFEGGSPPSRAEAVAALLAVAGSAAIVSTTGYASRELMAQGGAPQHFPMQGSMGFALAIGLGVSRVRPETTVFVLDGDGAALMRLGTLATVGWARPRRLVHVILDNGGYASTGGQPAVSPGIDFATLALACGFPHAATCTGRERLADAVAWASGLLGGGPALLRVMISREEGAGRERPELAPAELAERFRGFFGERA